MKKLASILIAGLAMLGVAHAEAEKTAKPVGFSFEGPFGKFDKLQLQHGYKVYNEVCSKCHSMKFVAFRNLADHGGPGFTEEQVKALAATFEYADIGSDGSATKRKGRPSDYFPSPYENPEAAAAALGAAPPDLSLITKSREGWHGTFNQLINGIGGPQYVYSVLTGYEEVPKDIAKVDGKNYNPYFQNGPWISMPSPLSDGLVTYDDKPDRKPTADEMARDVAAFLAWTAEPKLEERKQTGFQALIFLAVLAGLMYYAKKKVWSGVH